MVKETRYFGNSSIVEQIDIADNLRLPGGTIWGRGISRCVIVDDKLSEFVDKVATRYSGIDKDAYAKRLHDKGLAVDVEVMAFAIIFQYELVKNYPDAIKLSGNRLQYYSDDEPKNLSDVLSQGYGACFEISALAAMVANKIGLDVKMINGEVSWGSNENVEFTDEAHTFLLIKTQSAAFILDPSNQQRLEQGVLPHINRVGDDIGRIAKEWLERGENAKSFVRVEGAFDMQTRYYGFNNGTNINLKSQCVNPQKGHDKS